MQLSDRQQKTVAAAITILAAIVIAAAVLGLFWLLASFLSHFSNVFLPVAVAGIGAFVFRPYYDFLQERLRLPTPLALAVLFLSVLLPIGLFVGFFGVMLVQQVMEFVSHLPGWWEQFRSGLQQHWPQTRAFFEENPAGQKIVELMQGQGEMFAGVLESFASSTFAAGVGVAQWTLGMLGWVVAPVYFAFFLITKPDQKTKLDDYLPFLKPETRSDVVFLAREFVSIVVAFFRGQLLIAFLQGLLFGLGFGVVGLKYGFVLGFALGFLNVIPYLGSMLGLTITLPLAYFQDGGGLFMVVGVVVVFVAVQAIEGYILTPKIMGDRTGLHPMVIIFAIFFWGSALDGILGMILAIPLTAFLVVFWRLAKEKYITELV
jgi:predicted PurR-regulated permease PerM